MFRKLIPALVAGALLLAGPAAYAKKDGANTGGKSPQHMSEKGQLNTNAPAMGQDKGMVRADQRKSEQGLAHDRAGDKEKKAKKEKKETKGKSKGHDK